MEVDVLMSPTQWEYHWEAFPVQAVAKREHVDRVRDLGREGWELAAVEHLYVTSPVVYIFKRPILANR